MKTVLIVEDLPTDIELVRILINKSNLPLFVNSVQSFKAAKEQVDELAYDFYILDLQLDCGATGQELIEYIRSKKTDCKIVVITGYYCYDLEEKLKKYDVLGILDKNSLNINALKNLLGQFM